MRRPWYTKLTRTSSLLKNGWFNASTAVSRCFGSTTSSFEICQQTVRSPPTERCYSYLLFHLFITKIVHKVRRKKENKEKQEIMNMHRGDPVALLAGQWTCNSRVVGSTPGWATLRSGPEQATYTCVSLSPSGIIWCQPRGVISLAAKVTATYHWVYDYVTCERTAKKPGSAPSPALVIEYGNTFLSMHRIHSYSDFVNWYSRHEVTIFLSA